MYPSVKKEKVVPDVKPGEKAYKKIIDEYKAKRRSAPITKAEKNNANEAEDSFAFPASPGPAAQRRATIMPEIVEALDQEPDEVYVPVPTKSRRVPVPEPRLFQDSTDPPLEGELQDGQMEQDVPPPIMIMPLQGSSVASSVQTPGKAAGVEYVEDELVFDEELGVNLTPNIQEKLKDLGLQVPNINVAVNRLFPTLAEKKKKKAKKAEELPESVDLDKLVKVGIVDEFGDPIMQIENPVQVQQKRKSVPLSKKPMPLKWKKASMAKLGKKLDPAMIPTMSKLGGPPILEKISSLLHQPTAGADEEDGPPVLTKVQPTKVTRGQGNRKGDITSSTVINTARPTRSQQAAPSAVTPARLSAMKKKASPSPTKASKFKKEEGYEPYDWGFSDDEGTMKKKQAKVNEVVAEAAKKATARHIKTQRGRGSTTRAAIARQEEENEEEEEEEEEEPVIQKVTAPRGRGRPRKSETPQTKEVKVKPSPSIAKGRAPPPKATPPGRRGAPPKATPPTRSLPSRGTPQTRTGPSRLPPKPTPPAKSAATVEDESASAVTSPKQLPLKKRPAAYKGPGTPQSGKKSAPTTPKESMLETSPLRKSSRSQKPTERMLEYLQDKALVGKVKTEPGTEHVLELQVTPGKPSRIIEVTSQGKKFVRKPDYQATETPKGKVAQTKASKAEALKEAKAKAAAMARIKADKLKKSAIATKRKGSPSPAEAPAKKKQVADAPLGETPKRGRGRPRKETTEAATSKDKPGAPFKSPTESKFKERKSAAEMIEEYAANLMDDLKNKALEAAGEEDSEDEEPDPLKSSMGKRSNRSGSVSGRSNQDEAESDGEQHDMTWEQSRIIRRRASSDEEDDDEEEDIKIIRRARRASSKSPKAKQLSPGRAFSASPGSSPGAKKIPVQVVVAEESVVTVQVRAPPARVRQTVGAGVELVEDLHDDEAVENDHAEVEPAIEAAEEAAEEYVVAPEEVIEMEQNGNEEVVNAVVEEEVMEEEVQEAMEEVVGEVDADADMAEEAAEFVEETVEATGPKPGAAEDVEEVTANIKEQVGALKERIAEATEEVGTVEQAEAVVDEIRALTEQANAGMKEVDAPQLQVESELVEMQVEETAVVSEVEEQVPVSESASILQVPDIRIQAPSPMAEHGDEMGIAIETPSFEAPTETFEAPILEAGVSQPATNGIGEELLGAINQATEEGTLAQSKAGNSAVPEAE